MTSLHSKANDPEVRGSYKCMEECAAVETITLADGNEANGCGAVYVGAPNTDRQGECHLMLSSNTSAHPVVDDLRLYVRVNQDEMLTFGVLHHVRGAADPVQANCEATESVDPTTDTLSGMLSISCDSLSMTHIPQPSTNTTTAAAAPVDSLSLQYNTFNVINAPSSRDGFTAAWRNLKTLDLSNCKVKGIVAHALSKLVHLRTLQLGSNGLSSWTFARPTSPPDKHRRSYASYASINDTAVAAAAAESPFCRDPADSSSSSMRPSPCIPLATLDVGGNPMSSAIPSRYIDQLGIGRTLTTFRAAALTAPLAAVMLDAFKLADVDGAGGNDVKNVVVNVKVGKKEAVIETARDTSCKSKIVDGARSVVQCTCARWKDRHFAPGQWKVEIGDALHHHHGCWQVLDSTAVEPVGDSAPPLHAVTSDSHVTPACNEVAGGNSTRTVGRTVGFDVDFTGPNSTGITAAYMKWVRCLCLRLLDDGTLLDACMLTRGAMMT